LLSATKKLSASQLSKFFLLLASQDEADEQCCIDAVNSPLSVLGRNVGAGSSFQLG